MEQEPRKATDVILSLESKIEVLLSIVRNQDLNIKLLSNKLNSLLDKLDKIENTPSEPKVVIEAVNTLPLNQAKQNIFQEEKNVEIETDFTLKVDQTPQGFRRTSRPETFSPKQEDVSVFPVQLPKMPPGRSEQDAQIIVDFSNKPGNESKKQTKIKEKDPNNLSIPVVQRVVDKNGKSVFLADVEILDSTSNEQISKVRTNGTGKWMATLPVGEYKVVIRKRESLTKETMEALQNLQVDGTQSPLELQTVIIK